MLLRAEKLSGAPNPEIRVGDPKAIVSLRQRPKSGLAVLSPATRNEEAMAGALSAPHPAAQLVQLGQAETLGVFDHHQGRRRGCHCGKRP